MTTVSWDPLSSQFPFRDKMFKYSIALLMVDHLHPKQPHIASLRCSLEIRKEYMSSVSATISLYLKCYEIKFTSYGLIECDSQRLCVARRVVMFTVCVGTSNSDPTIKFNPSVSTGLRGDITKLTFTSE